MRFLSLILAAMSSAWAAPQEFNLGSGPASLERQGAEVTAVYRSFRLNRATGRWEVEVQIRNGSARVLRGPLVVSVEVVENSGGATGADGVDGGGRPFYDLSSRIDEGGLAPGAISRARTISLVRSGGAVPQLRLGVFSRPEAGESALALVQVLDGRGHPLAAAEVVEAGPAGAATRRDEEESGWFSLGGAPGAYTWRFGKPGHWPVWRRAELQAGAVVRVASPRLVTRDDSGRGAVPPGGGSISSAEGTVEVVFGAGAFSAETSGTVAAVDGQSLPGLLPRGWSPASAFWLELEGEPVLEGTVRMTPRFAVPAGESAVFVRWEESSGVWRVVARIHGDGTNAVAGQISRRGAYAWVVADSGLSTASIQLGTDLESLVADEGALALEAGGRVRPALRAASVLPAEVRAELEVNFTNRASLASGVVVRGTVRESYDLADASARFLPLRELFLVGYTRPGDDDPRTAHAAIEVEPQLLFGAEELIEAKVLFDVWGPSSFAGGIFTVAGGALTNGAVQLRAGPGDLTRASAVEVRELEEGLFDPLAGPDERVARAFELVVTDVAAGRRLTPGFPRGEGNAHYVLARVVQRREVTGLAPVERFVTDSSGTLTSLEPGSGERLEGVRHGGQYVLMRVTGPQSLVTGVARDGESLVKEGLAARVEGRSWLTFTDGSGRYRLVSGAGPQQIRLTDFGSGAERTVAFTATAGADAGASDVTVADTGPRVVGVDPPAGAARVPRVTAVRVMFSRPVNPASFGAAGLRLAETNGATVAGSLSLNLRNTEATFLPQAQLRPRARYTVMVADSIRDGAGRPLEGEREFSFTTESELLDRSVAQVTSFEPTNGLARMAGSVGIAEPEAPVVLVNETTGQTATVLSKPDGSFDNFIAADVDDYLSAVFVNGNGTRTTIPVSRQLYGDGSVGLFRAGGILEAESDGGPVRVLIEPEAVDRKAKFKLEVLNVAELLALVRNTPPADGKLLGGFRFQLEGQPLNSGAEVTFPVDPAELGINPGEQPRDKSFVLCEATEHEGMTLYSMVDSMEYENGKLVTHSPPFLGILDEAVYLPIMISASGGFTVIVDGYVLEGPSSVVTNKTEAELRELAQAPDRKVRPVPGAIVAAYPGSLAGMAFAKPGLQPGMMVTRTTRFFDGRSETNPNYVVSPGGFAMRIPADLFENDAILLVAHDERRALRRATAVVARPAFATVVHRHVVFVTEEEGGEDPDRAPPLVSVSQPAENLPVGEEVEFTLVLRDDRSSPFVEFLMVDFARSMALETRLALPRDAVSGPSFRAERVDDTTTRVTVTMTVREIASVRVKVTVRDGAYNGRVVEVPLYFGNALGPLPDTIPPDPDDHQGPRVLSILPADNSLLTDTDRVVVTFNEAVSRQITNGWGITVDGAAPSLVDLSDDQRTAVIYLPPISPERTFRVGLNSSVLDVSRNPLDQDPATAGETSFEVTYRTAPAPKKDLEGVDYSAGTVLHGLYAFTLDRLRNHANGVLHIHRLGTTEEVHWTRSVPPEPRAMFKVRDYEYRRGPASAVETNTLLVVVGGLTGAGNGGHWMQVFDISAPESSRASAEAEQRMLVAGGFISSDPTASVAAVKWSAPHLGVLVHDSMSSRVQLINLQGFILGANYTTNEWKQVPPEAEFDSGADENGDGDYGDAGDRLPVPSRQGVFGQEMAAGLAPDIFATDFDLGMGGAFMAATLMQHGEQKPRFQLVTHSGQPVGLGDTNNVGALEFPDPHNRPFRVTLDLDFPVPTVLGVQLTPVALVSTRHLLHIVDLTVAPRPEVLRTIDLGEEWGSIFAIERSGPDEYAIAMANRVVTLRRSHMTLPAPEGLPHPALARAWSLRLDGRSFGYGDAAVAGGTGDKVQAILRPPRLSVRTLDATASAAVRDVDELRGLSEAGLRQFLSELVESPFLRPATIRSTDPFCPSSLDEPLRETHHYVFLQAPGVTAAEVRIAVESLDSQVRLVTPRGPFFPPVMLTDHAAALGLGEAQTPVTALRARRLTDDATSEWHQWFVAGSLLIVREPLSQLQRNRVAEMPGRAAIWSGQFLRLTLDALSTTPADLGPGMDLYLSSVDEGDSSVLPQRNPGVHQTYLTLPGEYLDTANPSGAAPRVAGVDLQSGEYRHEAVDIEVEGRLQNLVLARTYESQSRYAGVMGRGWDFNLNGRVFELAPSLVPAGFGLCQTYYGDPERDVQAVPGDVMLMDGRGTVFNFRRINAANRNVDKQPLYSGDPAIAAFGWTGRIETFYESPRGEFGVLYKFRDGSFVHVSPGGGRSYFEANGRSTRVVAPHAASEIQFQYSADGRLERVRGDRTIEFLFDYYVRPRERTAAGVRRDLVAEQPAHLGLLARIRILENTGEVGAIRYEYDGDGNLRTVTDPGGTATRYEYDEEGLLTSVGRTDGNPLAAESIAYETGRVSLLTRNGQSNRFRGAVTAANERYQAGNRQVTVQIGANPVASIDVDRLGRPLKFGGLPMEADDAGRLVMVKDMRGEARLVYDSTNSVHRFRGNLLKTEEANKPSFTSEMTYDGSAWNRLQSMVDVLGVRTTFSYAGEGTAVREVRQVTGPVTRTLFLNEYGQLERIEMEEAGRTLIRHILFHFDTKLPNGERWGAGPDVTFARAGNAFSFGRGGAGYSATFNQNGQVEGMTGLSAALPSMSMSYQNGLLLGGTVSGGEKSQARGVTFDPANRTRVKSVRQTETGLPAAETELGYDDRGRATSFTTAGETTRLTFEGPFATRLVGPGRDRSTQYDLATKQVTNVVEQGLGMELGYDSEGRLSRTTFRGVTTEFTFYRGGQVATKTMRDGTGVLLSESYAYDGAGRVQSIQAAGGIREFSYFPDGAVREVSWNGEVVRRSERDAAGRMTLIELPAIMQLEYDDWDSVTGNAKRERFRLIGSDRSAGIESANRTQFDELGRLRQSSWPCGTWTFQYDSFGHLTNRTDPDGVQFAQDSSPSGYVLATTFQDGTRVEHSYDGGWRLEAVGGLRYQRENEDKLVDRVSYPDGTFTSFSEPNEFHEFNVVRHGGVRHTLVWKEGRVESISTSDGEQITYANDGLGRVTSISSRNYVSQFGYSSLGQLNAETNTSLLLGMTRVWSAQFDELNRLRGETYPSGLEIGWTSAANGLPKQAVSVGIAQLVWNGPGELAAVEYAGGLRWTQGWDDSLRRTNIAYGGPGGEVAAFSYGLSPGGRVLWEARAHEGRLDVYGRNSPDQGMRVARVFFSAGDTAGAGARAALDGLQFDGDGELLAPTNRWGMDVRAFMPPFRTEGPRLAEVDGVEVTYDSDFGAVAQVPVWVRLPGQTGLTRDVARLVYDSFGMVRRVERGSGADQVTITYDRDGKGRIVRRTVAGPADRCEPGVREYVWNLNRLIEEYEEGLLAKRYIYAGRYLVLVQSAARPGDALTGYVPLLNLSGSICGYATPGGEIREIIQYGAYGTPVFYAVNGGGWIEQEGSGIGSTLLFQGAWFDEASGLYQFGKRNLHPQLGRFLQRDDMLYTTSRALFTAFNGDPAGRIDPSGTDSESIEDQISDLKEKLEDAKDLHEKAGAFAKSMAETSSLGRGARVSARVSLVSEMAGATMKIAALTGNEEVQAQFETAGMVVDGIKLGMDFSKYLYTKKENRLLLTAIKAHAIAPFKSFEANFLHAGGSRVDLTDFEPEFWRRDEMAKAKKLRRRPDQVLALQAEVQEAMSEGLTEQRISLASGAFEFLKGIAEKQLEGESPEIAARMKAVISASEFAFNIAEKIGEVSANRALAGTTFNVSSRGISMVMGAGAEFSARGVLGVLGLAKFVFDASYGLTTKAITAVGHPVLGDRYGQQVDLFEKMGGYTGVAATALNNNGFKGAGEWIERNVIEKQWLESYQKAASEAIDKVLGPGAEAQYYLQGYESP